MDRWSRKSPWFILASIVAITSALIAPAMAGASADAPPANDNFSSATSLTEVPGTRNGTNAGATLQSGEPAPCGEIGATVWYRLTTSSDLNVVADTFGSSYDTVLAAYRGTSLQTLQNIECNDDTVGLESRIGFQATVGQPVYIQVGGFDGETGSFRLNLSIGGMLSGTVIDEAALPLEDVCVTARTEESYDGSQVTTGQDGRYRFEGLPADAYQIRFTDCAEDVRVSAEYYDDKPTRAEADLVVVSTATETSGIDAMLSPAATIRGLVTGPDGGPFEFACVEARHAEIPPDDEDDDMFALTGADGTYAMGGLAPGRYKVHFYDCAEGEVAGEWYDDQGSLSTADVIELTAGEDRSGVDAQLTEGGTIAGLVTDESENPPELVCVEVYDQEGSWVGYGETDESGMYETSGIHAGSFQVRFQDCSEGGLAAEWYDDQPNRAAADVVVVEDGAQTPGIDARLGPGASISGRVTDRSGQPVSFVCVGVYDSDEDEVGWWYTEEDGTYEVRGLPAGQLRVLFEDCEEGEYLTEWYDDRPDFATATLIPVTVGQVGNIDAVLDRAKVVVTETDGDTRVEEGGAGDTYSIGLTSPPSAPVEVTVVPDPDQLVAAPPTLVFSAENWDVPQVVVISAVDDDEAEGQHLASVNHAVASEDPRYDGLSTPGVNVLILDDELRTTGTELTYQGPAAGIRGQEVALEATLVDAETNVPVADSEVRFVLGDLEATGVTDQAGRATADLVLDEIPGSYTLGVSYAGSATYFGSQTEAPFDIRWHYTFEDQAAGGRVNLNPLTEEFQVVAGAIDTGIVSEPTMLVSGPAGALLITLVHHGGNLTVTGEFDLGGGRFAAAGRSGAAAFALRRV